MREYGERWGDEMEDCEKNGRALKCPYVYNTIEVSEPRQVRYRVLDVENIDGTEERLHLTSNATSYSRVRHFHDCLKENCAGWQDGRCVRR